MSINKIIVVLIFVSVPVCRYASADKFTLDEYQGIWFHVATIYPPNSSLPFTCVWSNIIKDKGDKEKFQEVFKTMSSGKWLESEGHGKIVNSELTLSYPSIGLNDTVYTVTKFNGGGEIILHNKDSAVHSSLLSRASTASSEAKAAFEKKAADAGVEVTYIDQNTC